VSVKYIDSSKLPTPFGDFEIHGFEDLETGKEHVVLTRGDISGDEPVLARVHSECLTGDALFSMRCDCGPQLHKALEEIAKRGRGAVFYLRQEGRGIGLMNKIRAYQLQDQGFDTVEANEQLGFDADQRSYDMLKAMIDHLDIKKVSLMTNNPRKVKALEAIGVEVSERVPHRVEANPHNETYLATKGAKLGHLFSDKH